MLSFIFVAFGGALGALFRYGLVNLVSLCSSSTFPYGTMAVNLLGSLIMGILYGIAEASELSRNVKLFLFVGMLGSFTTFSTFSLESFKLLREGEYGFLFWNVFLSVFLGICLVFVGYFISRS